MKASEPGKTSARPPAHGLKSKERPRATAREILGDGRPLHLHALRPLAEKETVHAEGNGD